MSTFVPVNGRVIPQAIADTSTTQLLPLGTRVKAVDVASTAYGEGEFIYLKGVASTAVGSVVLFAQDDHSTSLLAANDIGPVACAMSANVASQYGCIKSTAKLLLKVCLV